jgi:hypothetical protein
MTLANPRIVAILGLSAFLAACGGGRDVPVRDGPQAVHPSPSALAQGTPAAPVTTTGESSIALAETLFAQYCVGKTFAQSQAALVASGRFGGPVISEFSTLGARYARYELLSRPRAGVTLVSGSVGGIQCAVGVDNKGPNLYEDGSVKRSGY